MSVTVAQCFCCVIHPVHTIVDGVVCAGSSLQDVMPPLYWPLIEDLWPGPLTLLLPASPVLASGVSAGQPTVAVRMPSHPLARALIHASGKHVGQRDQLEDLPSCWADGRDVMLWQRGVDLPQHRSS